MPSDASDAPWLAQLAKLDFADAGVCTGRASWDEFRQELEECLQAATLRPGSVDDIAVLEKGGALHCPPRTLVFAVSADPRWFYLCRPGATLSSSDYAAVVVDDEGDDEVPAQIWCSPWMAWEAFDQRHVHRFRHA